MNPGHRGFGIRGFQQQETWIRGLAIREVPKVTWQRGTQRRSGIQVACPRLTFDHRDFGACSPRNSTVSLAISRGPISR